MNVLILDTETTGLDPEKGRVIEVATVVYNVEMAAVVACRSELVYSTEGNAAESINRIPGELLKYGKDQDSVWNKVSIEALNCDAVLAHNSDFDRQWVPECYDGFHLPWGDTCHLVTWPRQTKPSASLIALAIDHGVAIVDAHRALSDCLLIARLLTRCKELGHDIEALIAQAVRPAGMFKAIVSYADKDLAKLAGFNWDGKQRSWTRKMALEDVDKLPFKVMRIEKKQPQKGAESEGEKWIAAIHA